MQSFEYQQQRYQHQDVLFIQFAKSPRAGEVKTRLIPGLGAEGACQLHTVLVAHVLEQLLGSRLAPVALYSDQPDSPALGEICKPIFARHDEQLMLCAQHGEQLGERMANAFLHHLTAGELPASKVILVGSDCPGLDNEYLQLAIAALDKGVDLVFGPAEDGGYVLIGMSRHHPQVFEDIDWGSDQVLTQSLARVEREGLTATLLPPRADIDRVEDLALLSHYGVDFSWGH